MTSKNYTIIWTPSTKFAETLARELSKRFSVSRSANRVYIKAERSDVEEALRIYRMTHICVIDYAIVALSEPDTVMSMSEALAKYEARDVERLDSILLSARENGVIAQYEIGIAQNEVRIWKFPQKTS